MIKSFKHITCSIPVVLLHMEFKEVEWGHQYLNPLPCDISKQGLTLLFSTQFQQCRILYSCHKTCHDIQDTLVAITNS